MAIEVMSPRMSSTGTPGLRGFGASKYASAAASGAGDETSGNAVSDTGIFFSHPSRSRVAIGAT